MDDVALLPKHCLGRTKGALHHLSKLETLEAAVAVVRILTCATAWEEKLREAAPPGSLREPANARIHTPTFSLHSHPNLPPRSNLPLHPAIEVDKSSLVHPEIFVSTLGSCAEPGINVVKDFGYITSTVLKMKYGGRAPPGTTNYMVFLLTQEMAESEKGRALAVAKLRAKAAAAGANAILGLKVRMNIASSLHLVHRKRTSRGGVRRGSGGGVWVIVPRSTHITHPHHTPHDTHSNPPTPRIVLPFLNEPG